MQLTSFPCENFINYLSIFFLHMHAYQRGAALRHVTGLQMNTSDDMNTDDLQRVII